MSTGILIHSWDNNEKIWPITAHAFNKYWPDCPYPIYFITNFKTAPIGTTLAVGEERGFALNTIKALESFPHDTVLWTLEDYWFDEPVQTDRVTKYVKYVEDARASYIRLFPSENAQLRWHIDKELYEFNLDAVYKTSLGTSVWNKKLLVSLLRPEEDIWQFEMNSAKRTSTKDKFLTVDAHGCMHIADFHLMVQNKLTPKAEEYITKEGLTL